MYLCGLLQEEVGSGKIILNGDSFPWVESAKHVGNTVERNNTFSMDIRLKMGSFIVRIHSILQGVHFANPMVKMIKMYATSFYGSSLWNLQYGDCVRLHIAWKNAVRESFDVPRTTHFIEEISEAQHPMVMLSSRFVKFHQILEKPSKIFIRYLSKLSSENFRTSYGQIFYTLLLYLL